MVDVGAKPETVREATARATVHMRASTAAAIRDQTVPKGDVLAVARIAGIMGAKRTPDLIPLCHPIAITGADVGFAWADESATAASTPDTAGSACTVALHVHATVRTIGRTGVEMEALTAVAAAALAVYDMCKALDRGMSVDALSLVRKSGGRSGTYEAPR